MTKIVAIGLSGKEDIKGSLKRHINIEHFNCFLLNVFNDELRMFNLFQLVLHTKKFYCYKWLRMSDYEKVFFKSSKRGIFDPHNTVCEIAS